MENNELDLLKSFEVEELEDRLEFSLWAPEPCYVHTYTYHVESPIGMSDSGIAIFGYVERTGTTIVCPD